MTARVDPVARDLIDRHLFGSIAAQPAVQHVEFDPALDRWYVRYGCDGRDAATIYFDLKPRTLRYEVYFLPSPESPERNAELHAWLLRRNHSVYGAHFSIGPDGDVYLIGRLALEHLSEEELDRIVGVLYELTELFFGSAVRIAFGRRSPPPGTERASDRAGP